MSYYYNNNKNIISATKAPNNCPHRRSSMICNVNMCNDDWNIDHWRWSERCLLTRGDQIKKRHPLLPNTFLEVPITSCYHELGNHNLQKNSIAWVVGWVVRAWAGWMSILCHARLTADACKNKTGLAHFQNCCSLIIQNTGKDQVWSDVYFNKPNLFC